MNEPMPKPPIGAIHQNRACAATVRTAANCALIPPDCMGFVISGTRHQIAAATTSVTTESPTNTTRQCVTRNASSSGTVATSAPMPPAAMIQPA